ncbi:c-type cytochrome [Diaphorobacter aerolatus]|uniref:Cytochrome c n=1 Tax=Diaphorobacter aerolatus TaxID=1288495 RepID=A0A7H0GKJ5_9BURK|nr:cytochrome c [Diaphorobacter aerolatus]QNP48811.1 cytochrome c [Diaphorobacter aerolatus]
MSQKTSGFTKQMARNMFYGGTAFFALLFAAMIFDSERRIPERSHAHEITPAVVAGKKIWETRNCIGCHTLLGEGAYFAPELGNVYKRRGPDFIKAWMSAMPSHSPGRRQMPQFNLTEQQTSDLVEFLKWTGEINTENWPPNIEG